MAIMVPSVMFPLPKLTPTARPSGKLCMVMARVKSHIRGSFDGGPSHDSAPSIVWRCGVSVSAMCIVIAPRVNPRVAVHMLLRFMAGVRRLKNVAASMIPAENPSMVSRVLSEMFFVNSMGRAPMPVAKPASMLADEPIHMASMIIVVEVFLGG